MSKRLDAKQWSQFWQAGSATTFMGRFAENYDGEVLEFWEAQFSRCPVEARIVDLAAGNGALAALAVEHSKAQQRSFQIAAVDYADVHPRVGLTPGSRIAVGVAQVDFHIKTNIEQTGLTQGVYDLAMSQFGIEYGRPEAVVAEVDRILKPKDATFAAIVHADKSVVVAQARDGIRQARLCLKSGVAEHAKRMVSLLEKLRRSGEDPAGNLESERLRQELNNKAAQLESHKKKFADSNQIAFYVANCFAPFSNSGSQLGYTERLQAADHAVLQTQSYLDRMLDLVDVASKAEKIGQLVDLFSHAGFGQVEHAPFTFEGMLFGHSLIARR